MTTKTYLYDFSSIDQVAKCILNDFPLVKKWALYGPMGAGKTNLVKAMIKHLKVTEEGSSPTYSLVNEYFSSEYGMVYHLDLFRINDLDEAFHAGIHETIDHDHQYCFVEWPELIEDWMDKEEWKKINFTILDREVRKVVVE